MASTGNMSATDSFNLPIDIRILRLFSDGRRQTPKNVAAHLDQQAEYMSNRMRYLYKSGFLEDPGPADGSGMYVISDKGLVAVFHSENYARDYHWVFDKRCNQILDDQPKSDFLPDLVTLTDLQEQALLDLHQTPGLTIPSEFEIHVQERGLSPQTVGETLYALAFHGLAIRKDGMDVFEISHRGQLATDLISEDSDTVELTRKLRETFNDDERERLERITSLPNLK